MWGFDSGFRGVSGVRGEAFVPLWGEFRALVGRILSFRGEARAFRGEEASWGFGLWWGCFALLQEGFQPCCRGEAFGVGRLSGFRGEGFGLSR